MVVRQENWDVFICYATEDKNVARPLYDALVEKGLSVWYDESTLKLGDKLHRSINEGIAKSKYGLIILSKTFFSKDWPQRELEGLAQKEHDGQKVILPVWHQIDSDYVRQKSPILASLVAVSTDEKLEKIVEKVLDVIEPKVQAYKQRTREYVFMRKESTRRSLENKLNFLIGVDESVIPNFVSKLSFEDLKQSYQDVLDGIALFEINSSFANKNIFDFITASILERNKFEGAELFDILLDWYFETSAPNCNFRFLTIIKKLTNVSYLKRVVKNKNRASGFVAEFGRSKSFEIAGVTTTILYNIKSYLSVVDCRKIVDSAFTNDQIIPSWDAKDYLLKLLPDFQGKVDQEKIDRLYQMLCEY